MFMFQTDYQFDWLILSKFRFESIRQYSACYAKCDEGNILHVATLSKATQLILLIVDLLQYFSHIQCAGYDVVNLFGTT